MRACLGLLFLIAALDAQTLTAVAGRPGIRGGDGDGGPAGSATLALANLQNTCDPNRFEQTSHIAFDQAGNLYIADSENQRIRRIDSSGTITTIAGSGEKPATNARCEPTGTAGDGGPALSARLFNPADIVVQPNGNILIADQQNNRIRQLTPSGTITTISGSGLHNLYAPGIPATTSPMDWPSALALDSAGILYFAELHSNRIGKLGADGKLATVAGTGFPGFNGDRIPAATATLSKPAGIAFDAAGNLLIADTGNHRVRKVSPDGTITTIAGTGQAGFCGDGGPAVQACLNTPMDVKADGLGNIYVADTANNRVRKIDAAGNITTAASDLSLPNAIAISPGNELYVADWQNYVIRKLAAGPAIAAGGIVNGASFAGPTAPGAYISLFGTNFAGATRVEVNGSPVPLFLTSAGQINAQLPYETPAGTATAVVVTPGASSAPAAFDVAPSSVGIFLTVNEDGTINGPQSATARGRVVVCYVTGLGAVNPAVPTGKATPSDTLYRAVAEITATVGGVPARVDFAGLTPGYIGLGQVNLVIPDNAPAGDAVPIAILSAGIPGKSAPLAIR